VGTINDTFSLLEERNFSMSFDEPLFDETLVKSTERVRDLGEVFTPTRIVNEILDTFPKSVWTPHPAQTFFEPGCGDGNFLVAILDRKANEINIQHKIKNLEAGNNSSALTFHLLEALSSIYGVDLSHENINGGSVEHPIGARDRLLSHFLIWHEELTGERSVESSQISQAAKWIIWRNIQLGNLLAANQDGSPSKREVIPLVEYEWHPETNEVSVLLTTLGNVIAQGELETAEIPSLFGPEPSAEVWSGKPLEIHNAPLVVPTFKKAHMEGKK
jgi:hypothetical protein